MNAQEINGFREQERFTIHGETFDVPIRGIKHSYPNTIATYRNCEFITDFLNDSKFAKKLRHSTVVGRSKMHQYDVKKENRKKRYEAKKIIKEECEDYV